MASSILDEKLPDSVRKYPVLYDKSCAEFRNKLKKTLVWKDVAKDEIILGTSSAFEHSVYKHHEK